MALPSPKLHGGNDEDATVSRIADKQYTAIFDKSPTTNTSSAAFFVLKPESESYLPVESDHVQAILHQCGSFGVEFPIQTKLTQLKSLPGELQGELDPLLQKALMLTTMYDSNNIEALTKNQNTEFQPDPTMIKDMALESVEDSLHPPIAPPITHNNPSCDSNCAKCLKRLGNLARMQNLHSSMPSVNNASLVQECGANPATGNECKDDEKGSPDAKKSGSYLVFKGDREDGSNIKNNAVLINGTKNDGSKPNATNHEKSFDHYLPLDNGHLQAILEHGQAFGIKFPIQTKLKGNFERTFEKDRIKEVQKKLSRGRVFMNRPQTKDIENGVCSISKALTRDSSQARCTCCNCRNMTTKSLPYVKPTGAAPVSIILSESGMPINFMKNSDTPPEKIPVKGGADGASNLLYFAGAPNNKDPVGNAVVSSIPKSQAIMDLLKQGGGGDALRAIISQSTPFQKGPGKRKVSSLTGNIEQGNCGLLKKLGRNGKRRHSRPWGMLMKKR